MNLSTFHSLLTSSGQQAITRAAELEPTEETFLTALTRLQKQYPAELAKAALETIILRRKARAKFTRADAMYFTRAGLEMASSEIISRYRAARFAPFQHIAELGCGIGGDTLGLATQAQVMAIDFNPLHLALAKENLAVYGLQAELIESDLASIPPLPAAEAVFFDPGRRTADPQRGERRLFSVRNYQPPLALIDSWLPRPLGVKISPGVNLSEIEHYDCEIEFISFAGELKECVLWFGPLKTAARRATLLAAQSSPISLISPLSQSSPISPPLAFLYEPDPAILRAGLVSTLAAQLHAAQLDPDIAYLTADTLTPTPFARAFEIEAAMPFSEKRLREKLRALNVGRITVKKRGSPLDPDAFAHSLKLKGDEERILFLTHVAGKPWAIIGFSPNRQ